MAGSNPVPGSVWFYAPSKAAPIPFAIIFAASGIIHLYQCVHYKSFRMTAYLPFACALFAAGFALREFGAFHYDNIPIYLASTLLIYMSPPTLELASYHILSRAFHTAPSLAPIPPSLVLPALAGLSAAIEVLNALGVAYLATATIAPDSTAALGTNLLRGSLALQFGVIAGFYALAAPFHVRCRRRRRQGEGEGEAGNVGTVLAALEAGMGLVLVRTVFRAVEHFAVAAPGETIPWVLRTEWPVYVFDAAPMMGVVLMWNAWHPGRCGLPEKSRDTEDRGAKRWWEMGWREVGVLLFGLGSDGAKGKAGDVV